MIASETDAKTADGRHREVLGGVSGLEVSGSSLKLRDVYLGPDQLNDQARLVAYGEKMLAANPNSLPALAVTGEFLW